MGVSLFCCAFLRDRRGVAATWGSSGVKQTGVRTLFLSLFRYCLGRSQVEMEAHVDHPRPLFKFAEKNNVAENATRKTIQISIVSRQIDSDPSCPIICVCLFVNPESTCGRGLQATQCTKIHGGKDFLFPWCGASVISDPPPNSHLRCTKNKLFP